MVTLSCPHVTSRCEPTDLHLQSNGFVRVGACWTELSSPVYPSKTTTILFTPVYHSLKLCATTKAFEPVPFFVVFRLLQRTPTPAAAPIPLRQSAVQHTSIIALKLNISSTYAILFLGRDQLGLALNECLRLHLYHFLHKQHNTA